MTYIYSLEHPLTGEIRYIGKTRSLKQRYYSHTENYSNKRNKSHRTNWINGLKKDGLKPIIKIVDVVDDNEWKFWEIYWISQFITWGFNLVNHTYGGEGSQFGNITSFKKGNIPWNNGTAKPKEIKETRGKSENSIKTQFKKNHISWNKNKKGYKLTGNKKARPVLQYDIEGNFIKEYDSCLDAANEFGCILENIRKVCVGKGNTAKGFIWKYKFI